MDRCPQRVADFKDGVRAGVAVTACGLKRAGVDDKNAAIPVADGVMRMAVDDAVDTIKMIDELVFKVIAVACPVNQGKSEVSPAEYFMFRQRGAAEQRTHITVDSVNFTTGKDFKNRDVGQVASMEDHGAVDETGLNPFLKLKSDAGKMSVGQNADGQGEGG